MKQKKYIFYYILDSKLFQYILDMQIRILKYTVYCIQNCVLIYFKIQINILKYEEI